MLRRICTPLFLLMAYTSLAAPAPKGGWERHNPDKDCKIDIKDGIVTIELPGGDHELEPQRNRLNAPCLLRDAEGDFVLQVRISGSFRPSDKSSVKGESPKVAAGLVLIPAEKNYIRLEYGAFGPDDISFSNRMWGKQFGIGGYWNWKPGKWKPNEEHIYLRLERKGDRIYSVVSPDGKTWESYNNWQGARLPDKFKVGLAAYSTSTEPFKVRFHQFKLIPAPRKKQ